MSIRKRTWVTAKQVQKEAWVYDYTDAKGIRRLKTFTRRKDADEFKKNTERELGDGTHVAERESVKVSVAGDSWLDHCRANGLERTTVEQYDQLLRLHIKPFLGERKLPELTVPMVRAFEDWMRAHGRSAAMVRKVLVALGSLLGDAQESGLVARNVVRDRRTKRRSAADRRQAARHKRKLKIGVDIPSPKEIKAIVGALNNRWRPLFMTAIFTGLRISEIRGLRWSDLDFDRLEVHVQQRADRHNDIGAPKSGAGERKVPLLPDVVRILKEWKLACPRNAAKQLEFVFPTGKGMVESTTNIVRRGLHPTMLKAGVCVPKLNADGTPLVDQDGNRVMVPKYSGLHALRHFYASWCINSKDDGGLGLPPKVVQERLGHSSIVMTMDTYGHLFPSSDTSKEMAAAFEALMA